MSALAANLAAARSQAERPAWWKWAIAFTVSLGALMEVIDVSIVNVALPSMQNSLGATLTEIGWVITGYAMANVVIIPLGAWLGQYFGEKNYYLFTLAAFVAASVMCGLAASLPMLVVARVLQGIFGGGLLPKAQAILFETFPPHQHGIAQAIFGIGVVVGPAFGPTLGGYLTDSLGWRWIFFVNLPVGIVAVLMALLFIPDKPRVPRSGAVDYFGILLLALCLSTFQYVLEEGNGEDWFASGLIIILTLVSLTALCLFIWRELKVSHPAVNLRVLRYRSLVAGSLYSIVLGTGLYGSTFVIPLFTQTILHFTATQTGELMIPGSLAMIVFMPLAGALVNKVDARILVGIGSMILGGVMLALSAVNIHTSAHSFFWPLMFRGLGLTFMFIPLSVATLGGVPRHEVAAASGLYNLTRQIGGSIGIAVLTTLLDHRRAFHAFQLGSSVGAIDPATQQFLSQLQAYLQSRAFDSVSAEQAGLKIVNGMINQQALILAFQDVYVLVGSMFFCTLVLLFFLGKGAAGRRAADAH